MGQEVLSTVAFDTPKQANTYPRLRWIKSHFEKKNIPLYFNKYIHLYIYIYIIICILFDYIYIYNFRILQVSFSILPTSRSIALRQECQQDLPSGAEHAAVFRPVQTPTKEGRWLVVVTLW